MDEEPPLPQGVETSSRDERTARHERDRMVQQFARDHREQLVGLAARLVGRGSAEDVAQEAFVHLAMRIEQSPLPDVMALLHSASDLRKLMFRITACRAYDHLRLRWSRASHLAHNGAEIDGAVDEDAQQRALWTVEIEALEHAYSQLPPMQRIVHVLHHYYGFTDTELEATVGISRTNSRSLICRATRALKRAMEMTG